MVSRRGTKRKAGDSCELVFPFLPSELLVEVFQSLDSVNRTRFRRTCALWNTTLTTDVHFPEVRVSGRVDDSPPTCTPPLFWALTGLLHGANSSTKSIVLMYMDMSECADAAKMVRYIIGRNGRVGTLVFVGCSLQAWCLQNTIGGLLEVCGVAERAGWIRCRIAEERLTAIVTQYWALCLPPEPLDVHLWDLFENSLVIEKPVDLALLSEWIARTMQQNYSDQLWQTLDLYQRVDPRSTHYRDRWWALPSPRNDVDVNKLTKITAAAMYRVLKGSHWLAPSRPP
ncbi:uncharacterized protein LOC129599092 [Paramacrobiotus metropolitanus]|uniref:uncharacterized protein LOC129599092 n=1 Tax=Paramacrobiotus metropolitanus TaxID=2943436 RepID=UPI0024458C84|nr:uncharacterized protein LOC129599092 [Paramacrobiotus metropolitanus]